jgi:hypothetical protein
MVGAGDVADNSLQCRSFSTSKRGASSDAVRCSPRGQSRARLVGKLAIPILERLPVRENPARWRGNLDKLLPKQSKVWKVRHHPAMPYAELPGFMQKLRKQEGNAARALEFAF